MPQTQTLKITTADDMEVPITLVVDALQRYVHSSYLVRDSRHYSADQLAEVHDTGVTIEFVPTEA